MPDGATAIAMKVDKPLTHACYQVKALRGPLVSNPGAPQCATTLDGPLSPPTGDVATTALGGPPTSAADTIPGNVPQALDRDPR